MSCTWTAKVCDDSVSGADGSGVGEGAVVTLSDEGMENIPCEIERRHGIKILVSGVLNCRKVCDVVRRAIVRWRLGMAKWKDYTMLILWVQ